MITINDNRIHYKQFKDIQVFDYFTHEKVLCMKIPPVMYYTDTQNAIQISSPKMLMYITDYQTVEPVDLYIAIENSKE